VGRICSMFDCLLGCMLLVRELLGVWLHILVGVWVGVLWDEGCGEGSIMCCVM